jgi:protein SCO1/2
MYNTLGDDKKYVKVVFITLDPKRDTPNIADEYAKFFNKNFSGLSGDPGYIKKVADSYGVVYKIVPSKTQGYLIDHTDNIYVIYNKSLKTIFFDKDQNPSYMASYIKHLLHQKS